MLLSRSCMIFSIRKWAEGIISTHTYTEWCHLTLLSFDLNKFSLFCRGVDNSVLFRPANRIYLHFAFAPKRSIFLCRQSTLTSDEIEKFVPFFRSISSIQWPVVDVIVVFLFTCEWSAHIKTTRPVNGMQIKFNRNAHTTQICRQKAIVKEESSKKMVFFSFEGSRSAKGSIDDKKINERNLWFSGKFSNCIEDIFFE